MMPLQALINPKIAALWIPGYGPLPG
jgi:hypothetical protein